MNAKRWICFLLTIIAIGSFALAHSALAQRKRPHIRKKYAYSGAIPDQYKKSFQQRFDLYIEYVKSGQWDNLKEFLGGDKDKNRNRTRYTDEQKTAFVNAIRQTPIIRYFDQEIIFSTEILSLPLNKRWWLVKGMIETKEKGEVVQRIYSVEAYRIQKEWYFTPLHNITYTK